MKTLRLERFDANSNTPVVLGRFEINDIESDAFRLDAFIMNRIDPSTDLKVFDLDQITNWLDNPNNSVILVASSDLATVLLRKENNTVKVRGT